MNDYDEGYYKSNNYTDYLSRQDRYNQLGEEIMAHLKVHSLDQEPILDFGCATGMLIRGLNRAGYSDVVGADISEWAIEQCGDLNVTQTPDFSKRYGLTFALDVLEHMPVESIDDFLNRIDTRSLVFRMPICREGESDYHLECSRADPTHVIRWTANEWENVFHRYGFFVLPLNLHTIYNSEGVYTGIALSCDIPLFRSIGK